MRSQDVRLIFLAQKGRCFYCNKKIELQKNKKRKKLKRVFMLEGEEEIHSQSGLLATRDHFKPESKDGDNGWKNSVFACPSCNNKKGNLDPTIPHKDPVIEAQCAGWRTRHDALIERVNELRALLDRNTASVNNRLQKEAEKNKKKK